MIRFVLSPEGMMVPDLAARLPGRGYWLSARADVLDSPRVRGAFARAARASVSVPPDLARLVAGGLERRYAELLGLARRAGQAVCGFERVREWLGAGRAGLVIQAADGSAAEQARLLGGAQVGVSRILDGARLGAAFGRDHVGHAAVAPGRLATALMIEDERLAGVRGPAERVGG
jgi:uncharacterized protein